LNFNASTLRRQAKLPATRTCATATQTPRRNANANATQCGGFRAIASSSTPLHLHCIDHALHIALTQSARTRAARIQNARRIASAAKTRMHNTLHVTRHNTLHVSRRTSDNRRPNVGARAGSGDDCSAGGDATCAREDGRKEEARTLKECGPGSPEQIRTAVTALRGRRPRPLDDGAGCRCHR
jgi:hypothetical protein